MTKKLYVRNVLGYAAVSTLIWVGPAGVAMAQDASQSARASRGELASFDQFLDSHREIAEQLRRDPKLIQDQKFVEQHPALQTYLQQNPNVREQLARNPNAFMGQERGYDAREDAARNRDRDGDRDRDAQRNDADRRPDNDRRDVDARNTERRDQDAERRDADARRDYDSRQSQDRDRDSNRDAGRRDVDERNNAGRQDFDRDRNGNRGPVANFDQFLDRHPQVADQLKHYPPLANDQGYLNLHPELREYLDSHPEVRAQIQQNPDMFMRREDSFDAREADRERANLERNVNRGELARFDAFLDQHPQVADQLKHYPPLAKDDGYLRLHPELQQYLQSHPDIRAQLEYNAVDFMHREDQYDARETANTNYDNRDARNDNRDARNDNRDSRYDNRDTNRDYANRSDMDRDANRQDMRRDDHDTTRGELVSFDRFLDAHRETAEQLRRDPSLVKNQQFVQNHPDLQAYLQQHQGVREELYENPNSFMRQENRYDRQEDSMRGGQASFREFLGGHSSISADLTKDPNKARDQKYVQKHPEFQTYLKQHPDVQTALNQDPHTFMKSATQQPAPTTTTTGTTSKTTTTTNPETKPPKP